jgi:hypothetical protein
MAGISEDTRARNEQAVRAAMDRLLRGDLPPGGGCDLKTLAAEAGVTRTAFYPKRNRDGSTRPGPYQYLAEEFERRLTTLQQAGTLPDPKAAQIERLKEANSTLKTRLQQRDTELAELREFKQTALSRITAQQQEIERLRAHVTAGSKVVPLLSGAGTASRGPAAGTIGSCS